MKGGAFDLRPDPGKTGDPGKPDPGKPLSSATLEGDALGSRLTQNALRRARTGLLQEHGDEFRLALEVAVEAALADADRRAIATRCSDRV
jgi:hypothetical protein